MLGFPIRGWRFNPTLVRLRLLADESGTPIDIGFNPTLVRLRLFHPARRHEIFSKFQSHAGSIEAPRVRSSYEPSGRVSIPRWFD